METLGDIVNMFTALAARHLVEQISFGWGQYHWEWMKDTLVADAVIFRITGSEKKYIDRSVVKDAVRIYRNCELEGQEAIVEAVKLYLNKQFDKRLATLIGESLRQHSILLSGDY